MGRLSVLSWLRRDFRSWSRIGNPTSHQGIEHLLTLRRSHLLFHFQHADTAFPFTAWGGQHMPPVSINVGWEGMKLMKLAQNIHTKPDEGKHWSQQGADYEGKHRERPPQGAGAAGGRFKRRRGPLMAAPLTVAPPLRLPLRMRGWAAWGDGRRPRRPAPPCRSGSASPPASSSPAPLPPVRGRRVPSSSSSGGCAPPVPFLGFPGTPEGNERLPFCPPSPPCCAPSPQGCGARSLVSPPRRLWFPLKIPLWDPSELVGWAGKPESLRLARWSVLVSGMLKHRCAFLTPPGSSLPGVSAQSFLHCFTLTSSAFNLQVATPGVSKNE